VRPPARLAWLSATVDARAPRGFVLQPE